MMRRNVLAFVFVAFLASCNAKKEAGGPVPKPNSNVASYCVGRTLVSVPSMFRPTPVVTGQFKTAQMNEKEPAIELLVRQPQLTSGGFATEVAKRRAEISRRTSGDVEVLRFEKAIDEHATLFRVQRVEGAYISEIMLQRGSTVVNASLKSYNSSYERAEGRLIEFINGIKSMPEELENIREAGFCLGGVTLIGNFSKEAAIFHFRDGKGSTLEFDVDTFAPDADVSLLSRMSGPTSLLKVFDVGHRVLRARERNVRGMKAQEWLGWAQTSEQQDSYVFALETMRTSPSRSSPKIHLSLETGERLENGDLPGKVISEAEAVRLWDVVVDSIRPANG